MVFPGNKMLRSSLCRIPSLLLKMVLAEMFSTVASAAPRTQRPIIGILTEDVYNSNKSYIAASYVKFLESAGARVVPIISKSSDGEITKLFSSLNGVLFPGGGVSLISSHYSHAGSMIIELAKKAYDVGDYFPVWGTCLGFELMNVLQSGSNTTTTVISTVDAQNVNLKLRFTEAAPSSRMYSSYPSDVMTWLRMENITYNHHFRGITMDTYSSTPELNQFYTVLSTSVGKSGKEFISSIEGKKYPFYAVQWHPEKAAFEWSYKEATNHSVHAVKAMQAAANFFVSEAHRSGHKFPSAEEEEAHLIYRYTPTYTGNSTHTTFEQKYYF